MWKKMNIEELVYDLKEHLDMTYNQTEMFYYLIKDLEKENQKYKEVINKAINYIEDNARYYSDEDEGLVFYIEEKEETFCNNLLDILKEMEHD